MGEEVPLGADFKDWASDRVTRQRARPADADLPLLHAVRRRGRRQLPQALHPDLPAARDADDDGGLHQHGDGAHRRLCAAAQDARHAEDRVRGVPRLCRDARQGRLHAHVRRRHRRRRRAHAGDVRRLHRRHVAVRELRDAAELPAPQQDERHGPDRELVGARREPALRRHHQAVPRMESRDRRGHAARCATTSSTSRRRWWGSRSASSIWRSGSAGSRA